jgi:hypothetical protein
MDFPFSVGGTLVDPNGNNRLVQRLDGKRRLAFLQSSDGEVIAIRFRDLREGLRDGDYSILDPGYEEEDEGNDELEDVYPDDDGDDYDDEEDVEHD